MGFDYRCTARPAHRGRKPTPPGTSVPPSPAIGIAVFTGPGSCPTEVFWGEPNTMNTIHCDSQTRWDRMAPLGFPTHWREHGRSAEKAALRSQETAWRAAGVVEANHHGLST